MKENVSGCFFLNTVYSDTSISRQRYKLTETWKYAELQRGVATCSKIGSRAAKATIMATCGKSIPVFHISMNFTSRAVALRLALRWRRDSVKWVGGTVSGCLSLRKRKSPHPPRRLSVYIEQWLRFLRRLQRHLANLFRFCNSDTNSL